MIHADVTAAILAGGQARRLGGRDKSRLVVRGRPIIIRQLDLLQRVASRVVIVGGTGDRFADLELEVFPDSIPGAGAMGGVLTALEIATTELVLVVACDLPFLTVPLVQRLIDLARTGDAAWVVTGEGPEPLVACYRRRVRETVRARIAARRLRLRDLDDALRIVRLEGEDLAALGDAAELLTNVNTADDLGRVQ